MLRNKMLLTTLIFLGTAYFAEQSKAIPAFARKYRLSCKTCHTPAMPKLKEYGDSFAGNGFRLEDEESPRYYLPTGDDELSLIRELPLAIRLDGHFTYNQNNSESSDFGSPYLVKLMSGGELSKRLSYYFYFYMDEKGEVAGVEDAFLMYNNLFGIDFDLYLGQFQVSDPLFKRELRLTLEDYHIYTARIGISNMGLKYEKGVMATLGLNSGTTITAEVLNGNGIPNAWENRFDDDKYKSLVGRVTQDVTNFLSIGVFGYAGKEEMANNNNQIITNEAFIYGPDITLSSGEILEVNLQYLRREDSEVFPAFESATTAKNVKTNSFLAEIIYSPKGDNSKWYFAGLFNKVTSDFALADYQSLTIHTGYLAKRNIRFVSEFSLIESHLRDQYGLFSLGFVSAF